MKRPVDHGQNWLVLLGITTLYIGSHVLRMLRLIMLTIDERDKARPLVAAHGLTAFPGSLLPFKIGELLRLASFFNVYDGSPASSPPISCFGFESPKIMVRPRWQSIRHYFPSYMLAWPADISEPGTPGCGMSCGD